MKPATILQNKSSIWIALLLLVVIVIISFGLITKLTKIERNRDIENWQHRLSLMADVREDLLNTWLAEQDATLSSLAKNQSLQLYISQISGRTDQDKTDVESAQRTYLRNLLIKTATSSGFYEESPISPIKANLPVIKHSGIAIINVEGEVVISTPGMPELDEISIETAKDVAKSGNKAVRDVYLNKHAEQVMAFMVPVPGLSNTSIHKKTIATIIGLRTVRDSLYPLLDKEIFSTNTDVSLLVRRDEGAVVYLNKDHPNSRDMFLRLPLEPDTLATAYALANPGAFGIRSNYSGKKVLVISRSIHNTPWLLVQMITADEALRESDAHQKSLITSFSLGLAMLVFIIIASWRHGASLHARHYALTLEEKSALLARQKHLLESITDNIGDLIILIDDSSHIQFSNMPTAAVYQLSPDDLVGKTLAAAFGSEQGGGLLEQIQDVRKSGRIVVSVNEFSFNSSPHTYHSSFIPVGQNNILIVLHDITMLKHAQEKHDRLMKNLVHTLTHVIDGYDPNCVDHSAKTTKIATAIGREMNLSQADMETLELAAGLANIGKLFVPKEILTKTTELTAQEHDMLQASLNQTTKLLAGLDFDGPVLETIAQKNEYMDGGGKPGGLSGENILMTARILAVANAFVAMHSPRAYREPLSLDDILRKIYADSDKRYDKHVVAALMHVAENKLDEL